MADAFAYAAAAIVALWGVAHVVPTARVVQGFADSTEDNRRVITQEWIAEGFTMWFIAAVVIGVTAIGGPQQSTSRWVYGASAFMLIAVGVLTSVTGARTGVIWFKICPVVMAVGAVLLIAASTV
ncbi:MAG: hypothetical protein ACLQPH_01940 [Acidimicrobiales bacterium]